MSATKIRAERGQAMSEFLIGTVFLVVPLFLGVVYIGKYGDLKQQAIQASRYAAMERALDPEGHESDTLIGEETVARFFRDDGQHAIGYDDQAREATAGDESPMWSELNGTPMLQSYGSLSVSLTPKSIDSPDLGPVDHAAQGFNRLHAGYGVEADVAVPVANVAGFAPLAAINLTIGATTVIAGDPWNGGGAADVGAHFTGVVVPGRSMTLLDRIPGISLLFPALAGTPQPQLGCVKSDVVPQATAPGAVYDPGDDPSAPTVSLADQCY